MITGYGNEQRTRIVYLYCVSYQFFSSIDEMRILCWQYVALREYSRVCVFVMCQSRCDNYQQLFNTHYMLQMQIFRIFPSSNTWHVSYTYKEEYPNFLSPHRINVGENRRKRLFSHRISENTRICKRLCIYCCCGCRMALTVYMSKVYHPWQVMTTAVPEIEEMYFSFSPVGGATISGAKVKAEWPTLYSCVTRYCNGKELWVPNGYLN